jgi:hypothetical protein
MFFQGGTDMGQAKGTFCGPAGFKAVLSMLLAAGLTQAAINLSDPATITKGEVAAIQLNLYARVAWIGINEQYDAPILAFYDKTDFKVTANIYGVRDGVEEARKMIDVYRNLLEVDFIPYLKRVQDIELKADDLRITYRNRNEEGGSELLIWEGGKFKFPVSK